MILRAARATLAVTVSGVACGVFALPVAHADPPAGAPTSPVATQVTPSSAAPAGSGAPGARVQLAWVRGDGADGCIAQAALAREVALRLGRDPFEPDAPRAIEAVVVREGGDGNGAGSGASSSGTTPARTPRFAARIYVREAASGALIGTRELNSDAPTCDSLGRAAALAIAVAIDPSAALRPRPTTTTATTAAARVEATAVARTPTQGTGANTSGPGQGRGRATTPPAVPLRDPRAGSVLTGRFVTALGLLPALPSFGAAVAADFHLVGPLRLTAGMFLMPEVGRPNVTNSMGRPDVAFGLAAAWLGACVEPVRGARWALAGCASVMAGAVHAAVYAPMLERVDPGDQPWAAGTLGARFTVVPVGPLALEIGADLVVPFVRQDFQVTGRPDDNFQQTPVAGIFYAGLGLRAW